MEQVTTLGTLLMVNTNCSVLFQSIFTRPVVFMQQQVVLLSENKEQFPTECVVSRT